MTQQFEPDYGTDISCTFDLDPMMRVVSGTEMMAQVCVRRLICRKGSLLSDPLYGIDVRDFLGSRIDATFLARVQSLVVGELTRDERIFSAKTVATYTTSTGTLSLKIEAFGATGPFSLVLAVSTGLVTVQLLSPL